MLLRLTLARAWLLVTALTWTLGAAHAQSCGEVKSAFQLRHVGPVTWVPETPMTDVQLQICKHQGPTCCTRRMEQSYEMAVRRDTLHNLLSYSFELKYLFLNHAAAFQDTFHSLLSFTLNHTLSLFDLAYKPITHDARPLVAALYSDLALYLHGDANVSVERSVHRFYDHLFPLVYRHLLNPGLPSSPSSSPSSASSTPSSYWSAVGAECLRATRADVNPFGPYPRALAEGLARALKAGQTLMRALVLGEEVLNATVTSGLSRGCTRALVRMQYCAHCRGLTLVRPCGALCLNVMRGCLAGLAELQGPWRRYVALLEGMSGALAAGHELELFLLGVRERINDAILNAQLRGPHISAVVDKVCGPLTEPATPKPVSSTAAQNSTEQLNPAAPTDPGTELPSLQPSSSPATGTHSHTDVHLQKRSLPLKPSKNDKPRSLRKIAKEFMGYIQRYKTFFSSLPELLCESELVMDDYSCWSGDDMVESYTQRVVENGLQAQRHNPEIRVRGVDPDLLDAKEKLERFIQDIWSETGLQVDTLEEEYASGSRPETSGECDDEDGCEGSGGDEDPTDEIPPSFGPPTGKSGSSCTPAISSILLFLPLLLLLLLSSCPDLDSGA